MASPLDLKQSFFACALGLTTLSLSSCGIQKTEDAKVATYTQNTDCHVADFRALAPEFQSRCISCHGSAGSGRLRLTSGNTDGAIMANLAELRPFLDSDSGSAEGSEFMQRVSSSGALSHSLKLGNADSFMLSADVFIQERIDDPSCNSTASGGSGGFF